MVEQASSPREQLAALVAIALRAVRSAWIGGIVLAVGLAATALWALSTHRLYRSEAVILYERGVQTVPQGDGESLRLVAGRIADSLTSHKRLQGLIKEMKLYNGIVEKRSMVEAVEEMRKHLGVPGREGYVLKVTYDSESRDLAQKVLDRLVKSVVTEDTERRLREANDAKKFLETEHARAEEELKVKEGQLGAFLAKHPQLAIETGAGTAVLGGSLRAIDRERGPATSMTEVASLEIQAAQLEEQLAAAGQTPTAGPNVDPALAAARAHALTELQAAQRDLVEKQARYTDEHPDVKSARRRVADAETLLRKTEAALAAPRPAGAPPVVHANLDDGRIGAMKRALAAVRSQIATVRSRANPRVEAPKEAGTMVAVDTEWTRLTREVGEARDRQSQLEGKYFQAKLLSELVTGGQGGRLVIADAPFKPTRPVAGGRLKIALVGGAMSFFLALLAVIVVTVLDDRLYGARDVERVVEDSVVVVIPKLTEKGG